MNNFKVICIDDKNKPSLVPASSWIKEGETYTVVASANMSKQKMVMGFKLQEVGFPANSPYQYYLSTRFMPCSELDRLAEEAVEELLTEEFELI